MTVTVDLDNLPWAVAYGTAAEIAGHLKDNKVSVNDVVSICFTSGTTFYVFYRRGP